jgi:hypothetical protein
MSTSSLVSLLLGSAAIGALVSSGIAALSGWRERIARKKELLLSLSVQMAIADDVAYFKMSDSNPNLKGLPIGVMARINQGQLKLLFDKGKLSTSLEEKYADRIQRYDER